MQVSNQTRGFLRVELLVQIVRQKHTVDYVTIATTGNAVDFGDFSIRMTIKEHATIATL